MDLVIKVEVLTDGFSKILRVSEGNNRFSSLKPELVRISNAFKVKRRETKRKSLAKK